MTKIRVGVIGAAGRMGATVCQAVLNDPSTSLERAVDEKSVGNTIDNSEIEILAIGIGHDVSRYYQKAIKITDVQELGDVMISQLSGLFDNKKKLH